IMDQPVLVMLENPRSVGYLERRGPEPQLESEVRDLAAERYHAAWKTGSIGSCVLAAGIHVAFVDVEEFVAEAAEVLGEPGCFRNERGFGYRGIERGPTPPAEKVRRGDAGV